MFHYNMRWLVFLLAILICTELNIAVTSELYSGFMDYDFLVEKAARIDTNADSNVQSLPEELRLVVTSNFTCNGSISGFYLGAKVCHSGSLYPTAEIWRAVDEGEHMSGGTQ